MQHLCRFGYWIGKTFDLNDLFVFGGIGMACIGLGQMYAPLAWLAAGAALFWLGVRKS